MTGTLRTIECKDWKNESITYYEMDLKFQHPYNNYTYFSLEGESMIGFTDRIRHEVRKMYGKELTWVEE